MAAALIPDGGFARVAKREHSPLKTIWEDKDKKPGEKNEFYSQVYSANSITDYALAKIKREGKVTQDQWDQQVDPAQKIAQNRDLIEQHVDRRIQLFFMQLICCYRTPYHFTWIEANDEYGKGSKVTIKNPNGAGTKKIETEAAHSGTFPCLMAYPRAEWERGNKTGGFVYLKYGRSYMDNNATIEFDRYLNRADCLIDGTSKDKELREEAIKIVNQVAEGKQTVEKGMIHFMKLLEHFCKERRKGVTDARGLILDLYLERAQEVRAAMEADPQYFDQLLGVKVGDHPREALLRKIVYQKRFKLIQDCEAVESQIARTILTAQNEMLKKQNKSLKNVDTRLRYVLLEDVNPVFRNTLERLFCTSLSQLQADIEKNAARLREFETKEGITLFRQKHQPRLETLKRDLRAHFRSLDNLELSYRSELFKGLREDLNHWIGREFVAAFKKKHPNESMSTSMVSRLEHRTRVIDTNKDYKTPLNQRRKDISEPKAKKIADTFGVDPGLFLPGMITSVY
ncbi:MAG: hypothetical protein JSS30_06880 [Verrucomicrobia bacterium]|nr:hypothetical protein [Verrucomicrobiota bacterium]